MAKVSYDHHRRAYAHSTSPWVKDVLAANKASYHTSLFFVSSLALMSILGSQVSEKEYILFMEDELLGTASLIMDAGLVLPLLRCLYQMAHHAPMWS